MFRVAIVEDSPRYSIQLREFLQRYQEENRVVLEIDMYSGGVSFLEDYRPDCDVVLMDIEMPGMNGVETARRLRERDKEVCLIFVTYMAKYALEGYEVQAMDFLLKPLEYPTFARKLERALERRERVRNRERELLVNTAEGMRRVDIQDIYYVEVLNHTLVYHTGYGELSERGSIRERETLLVQYDFARCNNSFLINLHHVEYLAQSTVVVKGTRIPIGRTKKREFIERFTEFVGANI